MRSNEPSSVAECAGKLIDAILGADIGPTSPSFSERCAFRRAHSWARFASFLSRLQKLVVCAWGNSREHVECLRLLDCLGRDDSLFNTTAGALDPFT